MGFYLRSAGRVRQLAFDVPISCADAAAFANCQGDEEFGSYFCVYQKADLASKFMARADKVIEKAALLRWTSPVAAVFGRQLFDERPLSANPEVFNGLGHVPLDT